MSSLHWVTGIGEDWAVATNWDLGVVPTAADSALIDRAGTYRIAITTTQAVDTLTASAAGATMADTGFLSVGTALVMSAGIFSLDRYGVIAGGVLSAPGGAFVWDGGTLRGVTYLGPLKLTAPGAILDIALGLTVTGAGGAGPGVIDATGMATNLNIVGTETLDNLAIDVGSARFATAVNFDALTLGPHAVLNQVGSAWSLDHGGTLINDGVVQALQFDAGADMLVTSLINNSQILVGNGGGFSLQVNDMSNAGLIQVTAGGGVGISASTSFTSTGVVNVDGGVAVLTPTLTNQGQINLTGAGAYFAVENDVTAAIGAIVQGIGTIDVHGPAAQLRFIGSSNFQQGRIDLGGSNAQIVDWHPNPLPNPSVLVFGSGSEIDHTGSFAASTHSPVTAMIGDDGFAGDQIINNGAINASAAGGTLAIVPLVFVNNGLITVSGGDNLVLRTALSGTGAITIAGGGTVEMAGSSTGNTVTFQTGTADTLKLDSPGTFSATIAGFAIGDVIDLTGVSAASAQWTPGSLVVGTYSLALSGAYAGVAFQVASDGSGGTAITIAPPRSYTTHGMALSIPEGSPVSTALGSLTDSNLSDQAVQFSATIDWGDGTVSKGVVTGGTGAFSVASADTHAYADEGAYAATVAVVNAADASTLGFTDRVAATEADALTVLTAPNTGGYVGQPLTLGLHADFTDSYANNVAADFTATIDWGDGATSSGSIYAYHGFISVAGQHVYDAVAPNYYLGGAYAVAVTLVDADGGASETAHGTATINPTEGGLYILTKGVDTFLHGYGNDTFIATSNTLSAGDRIDGRVETNRLLLSGGGRFNLSLPTQLDHIEILRAQEGVGDTAQSVTLRAGTSLAVTVAGAPGGDPFAGITIVGAANADVITLGPGVDTLTAGLGETIVGGGGHAVVKVNARTITDTINGGTGTTTLEVTGGGTVAMGSAVTGVTLVQLASTTRFSANAQAGLAIAGSAAGHDTITLGAASQSVVSGGFGETIRVSAANADALVRDATGSSLSGSTLEITTGGTAALNDATSVATVKLDAATNLMLPKMSDLFITAIGSTGADTITAGGRYQTLTGGGGHDVLIGSALGYDNFADRAAGLNGDLIKAFLPTDQIRITDFSLAAATLKAVEHAGDTVVTVGSGSAKASFTLAGAFSQAGFQLASDAAGSGVLITHS